METLTATEARNSWAKTLDRVKAGETISLTRDHKPIAELRPPAPPVEATPPGDTFGQIAADRLESGDYLPQRNVLGLVCDLLAHDPESSRHGDKHREHCARGLVVSLADGSYKSLLGEPAPQDIKPRTVSFEGSEE